MARGGGGGNDWEGTWVPMVALAELAGTRDCYVAMYLALQGLSFRERASYSCLLACARVAASTWGTYAEALSPAAVPPIKNPLHTLLLFPPG